MVEEQLIKVGAIVMFTGAGKVMEILGDKVTIRDPHGKKLVRRLHQLRLADETQRNIFETQQDRATRHEGVAPK